MEEFKNCKVKKTSDCPTLLTIVYYRLTPEQRIPDELAALGELAKVGWRRKYSLELWTSEVNIV